MPSCYLPSSAETPCSTITYPVQLSGQPIPRHWTRLTCPLVLWSDAKTISGQLVARIDQRIRLIKQAYVHNMPMPDVQLKSTLLGLYIIRAIHFISLQKCVNGRLSLYRGQKLFLSLLIYYSSIFFSATHLSVLCCPAEEQGTYQLRDSYYTNLLAFSVAQL